MTTQLANPLEQTREMAVQHFSRMLLWVFIPIYAVLLATRWRSILTEPLRMPVYVVLPIAAYFSRPSPTRSLHWRGGLLTWSCAALTASMLLKTGLRQPFGILALMMTLAMVVLFSNPQQLLRWVATLATVGVVGVVLRTTGVIHPSPTPAPTGLDEAYVLVGGLACCTFVGLILRSTLQIYRQANAAQQNEHDARLDAEKRTQQLQRQELAVTMARGMAHDLANVIQVMSASIDSMSDTRDEVHRKHMATEVAEVTARATRTLRALLTVGKASTGGDGCTDIRKQFARLETLLRPVMGTRITVAIECRATGRVKMSSEELEQVLLNLAFNARDAMPRGGSFTLHAEHETRQGNEGADHEHRAWIRITVADTGTGVPASLLPKIFDPYVTTKESNTGTGLGLAIVARAVEDAGGRIDVESREDAGTTFVLRLPLAP